ncbi:undecaprenyl-phosphate glucose phosphotransferase [Paradesertivirga mongoliensis]|uniref:Undecaprenyl-phosphate glucose phosphotransferase n=1 Tax=Paradesertivirga mongoliensis TaxID=2100740 RepID=A0ABW4ZLE4_9SPHI|nr:undecaprenyl-phosphate glucose phosphotransferase [Pedobacter mongoliensis]
MQTRYLYFLKFILLISDLVLINFLFFFGFQLSNKIGGHMDLALYRENISTCNLLWLISSGVFGLYRDHTIPKLEFIYRATWRSIALHTFLFLAYLFFTYQIDFPRHFIVIFYGFMGFGFILSRFTGTALQNLLIRHLDIRKAVAVLGMNSGGLKLAAFLEQQSNMKFVGFLGKEGFYVDKEGKLIPAARQQLKKAATAGIKEIFVSIAPDRLEDIPQLMQEGEKQCLRLKFVPDFSTNQAYFRIDHMGGFPVLCLRNEPLEDMENRVKKRFLDIVISSLVILFIFSWLYLILALIIKLQSPGPILFKQLRSGRDNKPFYCYKFRSMRINDDSDINQATRNDDRITPIGKFMRRTSLDEFPQFFNVLFGDMSLIGPRPHMLSHTGQYRAIIDKYMVRHLVKPGISGWAQVNGFRGETNEQWLMEQRVEHDIWYMENWSAMLDIRIIFLTIINIFRGEDKAY